MITHYYIQPQQNPFIVARHIKLYSSLPVFSRHTKQHDDIISPNCIIHYDFKSYSLDNFLNSFCHENKSNS